MITLGVRAHDFGKLPASELASRIAAHKLKGIQLALARAIEGINADTGALSPGLARHLRHAFAAHGIDVAILGCYVNLVHPDPKERSLLLARFREHLRHARDMGASVVATETASLNADWSPHPDNGTEAAFAQALRSIENLVTEAERFGVVVAIEGVAHHVMSTPRHLRRMLDEIRSPNLQILLDPVNLLSAENHARQDDIVRECFDLFADRIVTIHAKDFIPTSTGLKQVSAGEGSYNYALLAELLTKHKSGIDVLMEETHPDTIAASISYLGRYFSF